MDKKFIVNIKGKDFVKFEGLLNEAHNLGLSSVDTEILQFPFKENEGTAIVRAKVCIEGKYFTGIGDANSKNVGPMIVPHIIRQAETRAIARSLRFATNNGMCSIDELGDMDKEIKNQSSQSFRDVPIPAKCSGCGESVTEKVKLYSIKEFNKVLCFNCQKVVKEDKGDK